MGTINEILKRISIQEYQEKYELVFSHMHRGKCRK